MATRSGHDAGAAAGRVAGAEGARATRTHSRDAAAAAATAEGARGRLLLVDVIQEDAVLFGMSSARSRPPRPSSLPPPRFFFPQAPSLHLAEAASTAAAERGTPRMNRSSRRSLSTRVKVV